MLIHDFREERKNGRIRISARIKLENGKLFESGLQEEVLYFDLPENYSGYGKLTADPFALIGLAIAINIGEDITINELCISSQTYLNLLEISHIYNWYFPRSAKIIDVNCKIEYRQPSHENRIGSFFSGGIDSLYNIAELKRLHEKAGFNQVSDLWVVRGMDIPLSNDKEWNDVYGRLEKMSKKTSASHIADIRTNAKSLMDGLLRYNDTGFALLLGAISKCFSSHISTALIGSYDTYKFAVPHASSPLVDPLFSCDQQQVRHFSCRASRIDKIKCIYENLPEVLEDVRVCVNDESTEYNCGHCEKCLRTKAELLICHIPVSATDFTQELKVSDLWSLTMPVREEDRKYVMRFWNDILYHLIDSHQYKLASTLALVLLFDTLKFHARIRTWRRKTRGLRDNAKRYIRAFGKSETA